jgi:hypothetical protein
VRTQRRLFGVVVEEHRQRRHSPHRPRRSPHRLLINVLLAHSRRRPRPFPLVRLVCIPYRVKRRHRLWSELCTRRRRCVVAVSHSEHTSSTTLCSVGQAKKEHDARQAVSSGSPGLLPRPFPFNSTTTPFLSLSLPLPSLPRPRPRPETPALLFQPPVRTPRRL